MFIELKVYSIRASLPSKTCKFLSKSAKTVMIYIVEKRYGMWFDCCATLSKKKTLFQQYLYLTKQYKILVIFMKCTLIF